MYVCFFLTSAQAYVHVVRCPLSVFLFTFLFEGLGIDETCREKEREREREKGGFWNARGAEALVGS